jgi:hypothetical protein
LSELVATCHTIQSQQDHSSEVPTRRG